MVKTLGNSHYELRLLPSLQQRNNVATPALPSYILYRASTFAEPKKNSETISPHGEDCAGTLFFISLTGAQFGTTLATLESGPLQKFAYCAPTSLGIS